MRREVFTGGYRSNFWNGVRLGLIDTYMDTYNSPKIPEHQSYTIDRLL